MQYELDLNDWRGMSCAPMRGYPIQHVEGWNGREIRVVHFAEDLSGEEQPPFIGWFYAVKGADDRVLFYSQMVPAPYRWRPMPCTSSLVGT